MNPLYFFDQTIYELSLLFVVLNDKEREEYEAKANIIRVAVNSAFSGKPLKLFEDNKSKVNKKPKKNRKDTMEALKDL